jgi:hypothetical protein
LVIDAPTQPTMILSKQISYAYAHMFKKYLVMRNLPSRLKMQERTSVNDALTQPTATDYMCFVTYMNPKHTHMCQNGI